jgi:predicted MFS family arabinose efflux permease
MHPRRSFAAQPIGLAIGGMIALAAAVGVGRFVYTPIMPVMAEAMHLSQAEAGLIASANFLGYLLGALAASTPALFGSRRRWLLGTLTVGAVTTGTMGLVSSAFGFALLRFAGGAASAFALVLASVIVLDRLAALGRSGLSSVHFAGVGIGITVSALIVSGLLAIGADWRLLWIAVGAVSLVATAAVAWLLPPGHEPPPAPATVMASPSSSGLGRMIGAYGLFGFGYVVTATFLVAIVRGSPQASGIEPFVWLVVGIAAVPSVALWVRAGARFGIRNAFSLACLVEAAGVGASVCWSSAAGALVAAALLGGTFMGLTALGLAEARALAPSNPHRAFALMTASFGFGQIVGPALAGVLSDRIGGFAAPSLLAAGALVAAAIVARGARPSVMRGARPCVAQGSRQSIMQSNRTSG